LTLFAILLTINSEKCSFRPLLFTAFSSGVVARGLKTYWKVQKVAIFGRQWWLTWLYDMRTLVLPLWTIFLVH